jgi:hypothetical protein
MLFPEPLAFNNGEPDIGGTAQYCQLTFTEPVPLVGTL